MYTIISGTNRIDSHTEKVAIAYQNILLGKNIEAGIFTLKDIDLINKKEEFLQKELDILIPTKKFIFIIPEYNGSYPGILKMLIDYSDVRNTWHFKKALLTGVASGRAGNLRGMDHLSDTLHYLKMNVFYNKLPISSVNQVMDTHGNLNADTLRVVNAQLEEYISY